MIPLPINIMRFVKITTMMVFQFCIASHLFALETPVSNDTAWVRAEIDKIKTEYSSQEELAKKLYALAENARKESRDDSAFELDRYNAEYYAGTEYGMLSHVESICYQIRKKSYDNAQASYLKFAEQYQQSPGFMKQIINMVEQYKRREILPKAEALCKAALQVQPSHKDAIVLKKYLVWIHLDNGDVQGAEVAWKELKIAYRTNSSFFRQAHETGRAFFQKGECSIALSIFDELTTEFSQHEEIGRVVCYQAMAYARAGEIGKSLAYTENAFREHIGWKPMPRKLLEVGRLYNLAGYKKEAYQVLSRLINEHAKGLVGSDCAFAFVHMAEHARVQQEAQKILASNRSLTMKHQLLVEISKEYRELAELARMQNREQEMKEAFQNEIEILDNVTNNKEKSRHSADAFYYSACACQRMGEYQKAAQFYKKIAVDWPGYDRRWHALAMGAECYDVLKINGEIPISDADGEIRKIYTMLVNDYPDSPAVETAKDWLFTNLEEM